MATPLQGQREELSNTPNGTTVRVPRMSKWARDPRMAEIMARAAQKEARAIRAAECRGPPRGTGGTRRASVHHVSHDDNEDDGPSLRPDAEALDLSRGRYRTFEASTRGDSIPVTRVAGKAPSPSGSALCQQQLDASQGIIMAKNKIPPSKTPLERASPASNTSTRKYLHPSQEAMSAERPNECDDRRRGSQTVARGPSRSESPRVSRQSPAESTWSLPELEVESRAHQRSGISSEPSHHDTSPECWSSPVFPTNQVLGFNKSKKRKASSSWEEAPGLLSSRHPKKMLRDFSPDKSVDSSSEDGSSHEQRARQLRRRRDRASKLKWQQRLIMLDYTRLSRPALDAEHTCLQRRLQALARVKGMSTSDRHEFITRIGDDDDVKRLRKRR